PGAARLPREPERLAASRRGSLGADAAGQGARRERGRRACPPRQGAEAREDSPDLAGDLDPEGLAAAPDDRGHVDRPERRQPPLFGGDSPLEAAPGRRRRPVRAGPREADIQLNLLTRRSDEELTPAAIQRLMTRTPRKGHA